MNPGYDPRQVPPPGPYGAPPGYPAYPQMAYPYAAQGPSPQDISQLNLLGILHFVYAGFLGIVGLFCVLYIVMGIALATAPASSSGSAGGPPPEAIGGIFAIVGAFAMILVWAKAALVVWSAVSLRAHRRMTLSFVVACIECLNLPFGTALGIATLMTLNRPSVKALYQEAERGLA